MTLFLSLMVACCARRYRLAYSSNFSNILNPVIENNYQLFMVERLIMQGARTFVKTMKEFDKDLALCDDPKKNTKDWQEPVYTDDLWQLFCVPRYSLVPTVSLILKVSQR